jgi:hypothetical protein
MVITKIAILRSIREEQRDRAALEQRLRRSTERNLAQA